MKVSIGSNLNYSIGPGIVQISQGRSDTGGFLSIGVFAPLLVLFIALIIVTVALVIVLCLYRAEIRRNKTQQLVLNSPNKE